eukprot:6460423-Pyramimonas_sp.AAC.1
MSAATTSGDLQCISTETGFPLIVSRNVATGVPGQSHALGLARPGQLIRKLLLVSGGGALTDSM